MSIPKLTLYFSAGASSMATHIALHEVAVPFEARSVSYGQKEMRTPEYRALNPEGKVPLLLIDGRPLTEVAATLFYLAKRFPEAGLLPLDDIEAEAHVVSWLSYVASTIHPVLSIADRVRGVFEQTDRRLGPREWAVGDAYSIADIHLFRLYWRFYNTWPTEPGEFPNLAAHYARMSKRPAVQKTLEVEGALGYEIAGLKLKR